MTLYTFYGHDRKGYLFLSASLDSKTGEVTEYTDNKESIYETMESAGLKPKGFEEKELFRAFYDGSRFWVRKGKPFGPMLKQHQEKQKKAPTVTFSRSDVTG